MSQDTPQRTNRSTGEPQLVFWQSPWWAQWLGVHRVCHLLYFPGISSNTLTGLLPWIPITVMSNLWGPRTREADHHSMWKPGNHFVMLAAAFSRHQGSRHDVESQDWDIIIFLKFQLLAPIFFFFSNDTTQNMSWFGLKTINVKLRMKATKIIKKSYAHCTPILGFTKLVYLQTIKLWLLCCCLLA